MRPEATNWFLLRGLVRESADWADFPLTLQASLPGSRVFCLDLPGNGRYFDQPAPTKLSAMVDVTRQEFMRLRDANPAARNYVLAISLGAMAAIDWLNRHPKDLDGAVLINTSLRGVSPFYKRLSPGSYPTILRAFLSSDTQKREELILRLTTSRPQLPSGVLAARTEARRLRPVSRKNAVRQILAALRTERPKAPPVPVLLLNSLGDRLVHPDCSERLRQLWNVPMKRHAWANHDLPLDDPQWTLDAVKEWLSTVSSAKPATSR